MTDQMQGSDIRRLALEEDMTIYNAMPIKEKLLSALDGCHELELDLSLVGEIDTTGVQLLIMAKQEANRLLKSLRLVAHSAPVREVLDFYNIAAYFGDPLHIPARERA
ncbi:MAG: STAS domain-containing protein [Thiobacillus sp.]|nr:STAS domain-containing protein [Thiobacillus sp.]